jgi:hypothetical protein
MQEGTACWRLVDPSLSTLGQLTQHDISWQGGCMQLRQGMKSMC